MYDIVYIVPLDRVENSCIEVVKRRLVRQLLKRICSRVFRCGLGKFIRFNVRPLVPHIKAAEIIWLQLVGRVRRVAVHDKPPTLVQLSS
jgi:hypothetical protein